MTTTTTTTTSANNSNNNNNINSNNNEESYIITCLTRDQINLWKKKVLQIAKGKRKENGEIWTKDIAKKFGQVLKLIKHLLKNVRN